jgi:histone H4
MMLTISPP